NNKSAAKRARGLLREMDERAAQEAVAAAPRAPDPAATAHDEPAEVAPQPEAQARPVGPVGIEELRAVETARKEAEAARLRDEQRAERARAAAAEQAREEAREQARTEARREADKTAERRRIRLAELADEAESAATDTDLASARRRMAVARREWTDLAIGGAIDPEIASRLAGAESRLTARETELHEADARARREALNRLH